MGGPGALCRKKNSRLRREFFFFGKRGALGPQIKWGAQGPCSEKKIRAEARIIFREKGGPGPPIYGGPWGPPFPKKKIRALSANFFFSAQGPLGPPFNSGAQGPPKNQGPRAPSLSGGPGGLCPPGKTLNYMKNL